MCSLGMTYGLHDHRATEQQAPGHKYGDLAFVGLSFLPRGFCRSLHMNPGWLCPLFQEELKRSDSQKAEDHFHVPGALLAINRQKSQKGRKKKQCWRN